MDTQEFLKQAETQLNLFSESLERIEKEIAMSGKLTEEKFFPAVESVKEAMHEAKKWIEVLEKQTGEISSRDRWDITDLFGEIGAGMHWIWQEFWGVSEVVRERA